jgi:hypothetical protein
MSEPTKKFAVRCKTYFGTKPGQNLREFAAELKELSAKDKNDLIKMFNAEGLPTTL